MTWKNPRSRRSCLRGANNFAQFKLFKGLLLGAIFLALFGLGCENDIEKVKLITGKDQLPVETAQGLNVIYSDSAVVKVKLKAKTMRRFSGEEPYTEMPDGIHVAFFDNSMQTKTTLTASKAIKKDKSQMMEAFGNVEVVNAKGEKLNTEHLVWNEGTKKISSDEFVKISTTDKIIFGNGFESNQDFSNYRIFKITGTININRNENPTNP
ncbi:MAG: LPS export ABC transporter periplasmic protein LptC [Bacteroidota bacterium]